ncbi:uncharacterized protein LOC115097028 [Rhinatrema bivittatum]|uniref:uncharacterized protein LOC115097028 n=1 Tax=Rhinatrema bivittatum TaxID=194408 RepID=UPI00112C0150|nr:uncharacterized protein LOC115097028 [Rhinatrema bivittatum]XP_029468302.1 uncharacterized protein LOC115097028 [Rhinatrema bivittatum]XP_029468303.1 uncharacterized protein LOC115097028 [Rhinatrema bivittatum]
MTSRWNSSSPGISVSKSDLPITDIMENGFVAGISSVDNSSLDSFHIVANTPKTESWDSNLDSNILKSTSQPILKASESSLFTSSNGGDMPSQAVSNYSLASLCKTPVALAPHIFDLSSLASEHNSRLKNSVVDLFGDNKISTPCKEEKNPKLMETQASKSLESSAALIDLSGLLKPAPLIWEISEITSALDNTLSLEASIEEMRSPTCSVEYNKAKALEMSSLAAAMCYPWTGVKPRKNCDLAFESFSYEKQLSKSESATSLLVGSHMIKPFDFAIASPDDRWRDKPSKLQKSGAGQKQGQL